MYLHSIRTSVEERSTGLSHRLLNAPGDLGALVHVCLFFHDY